MNLKQKIKKIRRLSAAEIIYRSKEQLYLARERREHPAFLRRIERSDFNFFTTQHREFFEMFGDERILDLLRDERFRRTIAEPLNAQKKERFRKEFAAEYRLAVQRADAFLENRFSFLGVSFQLPEPIPWQSDPVSLTPFPTGFYRDIDIFTNRNPGDVKHVWEVNRLQFVIELAKAYYLTGEEKYRLKTENLLGDWYEKNPYQTGIAWTSALEVGVRALALIWILYFYLGGEKQNPEILRIILKLLYLSGHYLNHHLSVYFSPYNHLIGETAALFAIGFLFPGFRNADHWARKALNILDDQVEKQFHPDGGTVEQATFYHHFTLGFYLMAMSFLRHNGREPSQRMKGRVEKALEFAMYLTRPDGTLPYIGDIDDARSIYFSNPTSWDFRSYQCFGAVWFDRPDMKYMAGKWHEDAFWMLGQNERAHFEKLEIRPPSLRTVFLQDSGYYVLRSGYAADDHFSFMDAGPLAHGVFKDETPSAAHGHADLLSVEIAPFGETLLIDPGFSNYRGEYDWHTYFRSTAAHNTVVINGQSQAKQTGILKWSFAPDFKVRTTIDEPGVAGVCAEHYGYRRLSGAPVHRRWFVFVDETFWLMADEFSAENNEPFDLQWNFHFKDEVRVLPEDHGWFTAKGTRAALQMLFAPLNRLQWESDIFIGGEKPQHGWISPTYRARTPAPLLQISARSTFPLRVLTLFLPANEQSGWKTENKGNEIVLIPANRRYRIAKDAEIAIEFAGKKVALNLPVS